MLGIGLLLFC